MPPVAIAVFVLLNLQTVYKSSITPDNFFTNTLRETRNALAQYDNFSAQKNARQKILGSLKSLPKNAAGVYVLVIGESQNKGHMSAYGYHRPTTPWLQSIKNQHGFLLFDNAYSCHSHTVPVLTYALTAKNQYNTLPLEQAASIIEIAQAADFHTVWISNQVKYGAWDTPVSVIADQSQTQYWLNGHLGETTQTTHFDLSLVDVLKKLPVFDKALIVVHLMGNHGSYEERYPHAFNRWTGKSHIDKYDNSILYNDFVMKQLFSTVKDLPNFQGMIYFSDHADDVDAGLGHDASRFTFDMARIPLYMYFSDNYIQKYPHTMAILKKHTSAYFTKGTTMDLDEVLTQTLEDVRSAEAKITALEKSRDDLRLRLKSCVQNLRVLRYNAFDNTGSDLSYSVALVDEENNGVVLSSIYGREENRCYAKPVIAGKSQYVLSKEEQEVLQQK